MTKQQIELGDRVQDKISKLKGIVVAKTDWLYGCLRLTVQPESTKDDKPAATFTLDDPQVVLLEKKAVTPAGTLATASPDGDDSPPAPRAHGGRNDPLARPDPTRRL